MGNFGEFAGLALLFFVFFLNGVGDGLGVDAGVLGVNFPERRMVLDAFVEERLGDGGIVHFAVAVAAVADEVDDHVGIEIRAIFGGEAADAHDGVGIFRVDVEDGNALAARDAGSEARGMLLRGARGEADEIVDDDVNGAADGISRKVGEIQRFRQNALAGKGGVAVHDDGPDFVEHFLRAIDLRALHAMAGLLGARAAHGHGIDSFEVAGIGNQMDVDCFAGRGGVSAGGANVILHVARAEHAAGIDIFKARDNFVRRFAGDVRHHVQAAAVAHGHDGVDAAKFARGIENGIEQRNERGVAFQRKTFGAQIAALQNLLEEIGADQTLEIFSWLTSNSGPSMRSAIQRRRSGSGRVHEFHADGAAIVAARFFGEFAGEALKVGNFRGAKKPSGSSVAS